MSERLHPSQTVTLSQDLFPPGTVWQRFFPEVAVTISGRERPKSTFRQELYTFKKDYTLTRTPLQAALASRGIMTVGQLMEMQMSDLRERLNGLSRFMIHQSVPRLVQHWMDLLTESQRVKFGHRAGVPIPWIPPEEEGNFDAFLDESFRALMPLSGEYETIAYRWGFNDGILKTYDVTAAHFKKPHGIVRALESRVLHRIETFNPTMFSDLSTDQEYREYAKYGEDNEYEEYDGDEDADYSNMLLPRDEDVDELIEDYEDEEGL